jgi:glutamyl-tRNA synthetase
MREKLYRAMPVLKARAKTLLELLDSASFLFTRGPLTLDEKAIRLLDAEARTTLNRLLQQLEGVTDWTTSALEAAVQSYAERAGQKLGKIAQPLRAALTGSTVSPPVFDVMAVLGREEALARIREQMR